MSTYVLIIAHEHICAHTLIGPDVARQISIAISCTILRDEQVLITARKHMLIKIQCCSMTRHFYTVSSSGMSCKFCGKAFNRGFNRRRHENEYCPLKSEEREMSETKVRAQKMMLRALQLTGLRVR